MTDARDATSYGYDTRDRLARITQPGAGQLDFTYKANGNRMTLTATVNGNTHTTSYTYDDASRLDHVLDRLGRVYDFDWDANGNRSNLGLPNGVTTSYAYDALNRLTNLTTNGPQGAVQSYAFTLGAAGNRERIDEAGGISRSYGYDALYRLTSEAVTVGGLTEHSRTWMYDDVGNRQQQVTTLNVTPAPGVPIVAGTLDYSYDIRDRLLTEALAGGGTTSYGYDANGNLTTKSGGTTYTWDFDDRLIKVETPDGTRVEHRYDADGNRVQTTTTHPGQALKVTRYLVDTSGALSHVVAEIDGTTNTLEALYVRGSDELLSVMRPDAGSTSGWTTRFYHADGIGSVRRLTDEAAAVTDTYTYSAFGELLVHTGTDTQPYAFTGEPYDPNVGFQYHRARWMDPTTGRFLSIDSWEGSPFDPPSLHKYAYAGSDTIDKKDPTGRFSMAEFGAVVAIVAVISAIAHASYTAVTGGTKSEIALSAGKGFLLGAGVAATVYAVLWGGTIAYIAGATGASLATARQVLSAFHRANINIIRLEKDLVVYRWYGGRAALMRPWWTTELYGSAAEATRNLALDPRFGNTAERMATGVIQRGTQVLIGQAAAQGVLPGLGIQVYAADPSVVRIVTAY